MCAQGADFGITERPFSGKYDRFFEKGIYSCVVCNQELFSSDSKYDSGSGWPAFTEIMPEAKIDCKKDTSAVGMSILRIIKEPGLIRTCISCKLCGTHLGHMFYDGPKPTGKRYCINSKALNFKSDSIHNSNE